MLKEVVSVLAVICGVALVTSTPIFPNHHALGQIDPVDACLFLCNICFDENDEMMMRCANRVCLSEHMVTEYSLYVIKQLCPINSSMPKLMPEQLKH